MILSTIVVVDKDGNEHPYHPDLLLPREGADPRREQVEPQAA